MTQARSVPRPCLRRVAAVLALALALAVVPPSLVFVAPARAQVQAAPAPGAALAGPGRGTSLEQAADTARNTGRTVAISLVGLALAIAAVILVFKRDFKEAAAIFAVGVLAVVLATPAGLNALNDLVAKLFGGG